MNWSIDDMPDQAGKVAIITGANSGIGLEAAKALARKGAEVVLACRNFDKGLQALNRIHADLPEARLQLHTLDLSSLESVREFAEKFQSEYSVLDVLMNNAGVMTTPDSRTQDGFELQFGTNHLGHFALTGLLMNRLENASAGRVVTISSTAHRIGKIDFANLNAELGYNKVRAYGLSKLAGLLFAYEMQRRLRARSSPVLSLAAHPGSTRTELARHSRVLNMVYQLNLAQSAAQGALPGLRAATDADARGGEFYGPGGFLRLVGPPVIEKSSKRSYDEMTAAKLWQVSEQLTGIRYWY
jgi:NAD(P)-dependent dehydrogenase (short-subunit alcohol dehydrogenase family)